MGVAGRAWPATATSAPRCGCRSCARCGRTGLSILFGVPLAWLLARVQFPGRAAVRALCTLSMVLPPVVGGVALFFAFGRRGIVGQYLDRWFDIRLPFTTCGVVVAQTFVAMPFLVITVEAALRQLDRRFEDASRTLGRVELVHVPPGHACRRSGQRSSPVPCCRGRARSASSGRRSPSPATFPGRTQTMPLADYLALETNPQEAIVLGLVLTAISFAVLVGLRDRWLGGGRPSSRCRSWRDAVGRDRRRASVRSTSTWSSTSRPGRCWRCSAPTGRARRRVLRCLAGLVPLDAGRIAIDERRRRRARGGRVRRPPSDARSASCSRTTCCSPT